MKTVNKKIIAILVATDCICLMLIVSLLAFDSKLIKEEKLESVNTETNAEMVLYNSSEQDDLHIDMKDEPETVTYDTHDDPERENVTTEEAAEETREDKSEQIYFDGNSNMANGSFVVEGSKHDFLVGDGEGVYYFANGLEGTCSLLVSNIIYTSGIYHRGYYYFSIGDDMEFAGIVYRFDPIDRKLYPIITDKECWLSIIGAYDNMLYIAVNPGSNMQEEMVWNLDTNTEAYYDPRIFTKMDMRKGILGALVRHAWDKGASTTTFSLDTRDVVKNEVKDYDWELELPVTENLIEFIYPYYIMEDAATRRLTYFNIETGEQRELGKYLAWNITGSSIFYVDKNACLYEKNLASDQEKMICDLGGFYSGDAIELTGLQLVYLEEDGGTLAISQKLSVGVVKVPLDSAKAQWLNYP